MALRPGSDSEPVYAAKVSAKHGRTHHTRLHRLWCFRQHAAKELNCTQHMTKFIPMNHPTPYHRKESSRPIFLLNLNTFPPNFVWSTGTREICYVTPPLANSPCFKLRSTAPLTIN